MGEYWMVLEGNKDTFLNNSPIFKLFIEFQASKSSLA